MDDPESLTNQDPDFNLASEMITCPVFARTDKDAPVVGTEGPDGQQVKLDKRALVLGNFPRAIVQLINK